MISQHTTYIIHTKNLINNQTIKIIAIYINTSMILKKDTTHITT